jgi:hypothetical protein
MQPPQEPAAPQSPAPPAPIDRDALREQIRNAIDAALEGAQTGPAVAVDPPTREIPDIPPQAAEVAFAFLFTIVAVAIGIPIARAIARWIDRRGQPAARLAPELSAQLTQLSQSVEAIAIEVERISEGQRFTTRLLTEQQPRRAVGAGEQAG